MQVSQGNRRFAINTASATGRPTADDVNAAVRADADAHLAESRQVPWLRATREVTVGAMLESGLLLEHVSDGVVALDEHLRIREFNDRISVLFRRPRAELAGRALTEVFPDLSVSGVGGQLRAVLESGVPQKLEMFLPSLFSWYAVVAVPQPDGLVLLVRDISNRARLEEEEAAKAAVRKVIEMMPLCVTITRGPQHRIEQANLPARSLVGDRLIEGELVEKVLPEALEQGFIALLDGVYASGKAFRGEEVMLRWKPGRSGEERSAFFDLVYQPLIGDSGKVEGVLHLGVDVTEKVERRILWERYASEREAVLQQLEEGIIITDSEGSITFVNEAAERMHGVKLLGVGPGEYTQAYSLLTDGDEPHPPELLPLARAVRDRAIVEGAIWKICRPDGSILRVRGSAKPVLGADGSTVACVLTIAPFAA